MNVPLEAWSRDPALQEECDALVEVINARHRQSEEMWAPVLAMRADLEVVLNQLNSM